MGGCVLQQLLPPLAEQHGELTYPNELFEQISEIISLDDGDNVVIYKNGNVKVMGATELGVGEPRRHSEEMSTGEECPQCGKNAVCETNDGGIGCSNCDWIGDHREESYDDEF